MASNVEKDLAEKLKSSSTSEIYKTLVKIRKNYVRSHDKMKKLEKYSVIKSIIPFMEHPKFCNISLSIIADGCLELSFVNEVIKCDGPKALMRIMKSSVNDDIHNRACRALGNIAKFDIGFKAVHLMKPVSNIVNFLSETKDVNCQQTAVRTLMILGKCSKTRELIAQENGLIYIAKLLHSSDVQVLICSIKALANLTNNCSISCARQLLEFEFHKALVELHSHSEKSVRNHALISLKNLSFLEEIRSGLVKVGAVKLFTEVLSAYESHETSKNAALALCKCLDHIHMWSHNGTDRSVGLKALLAVLKNSHLQDIHISVLTALIPLSFEFNVTDILLSLDVLQILIEILDSFMKRHECKTVGKLSYKYISDEESLSSDHKLSNKVDQLKYLATSSSQKLLESDLPKDKNVNSFEYGFKDSGSPKKSHDVYKLHKWDSSLYGYNSVTSDYSGSCSPTGTCSPPMQKRSTSPGFSYDVDVGSPSTGHTSSGIWSPASLIDESTPYNVNCWSPVVSTHSSSPVREFELMEYDENEYIMKDEFSLVENFNSAILDIDTEENTLEMSVSSNSISLRSDTVEEIKLVSKLSKTNSYDDSKSIVPSKKLKTHHLPTDNPLELQFQTAVDINIKEIDSNSCLNLENIASCSHNLPQKNSSGKIFLGCSETVMDKDSKTKDACKSQVSESLQVKNSSAAVPSKKLKTHHLPTDNPLELQFQTAVDINIKEIDSNSCLNLENIASCSHNLPQKNSSGKIFLGCSETVMDKDSKTKDACKSQVSESLQVKNSSAAVPSKKLKTHHLPTDNPLELQFQTAVDINIKEIDSNSCLNLENIASCSHNLPQKNSSGKIFLGCSETVMDKDSKTKDACKSQVSESLQVKNSSAAVPSKKLKTHHLPTDNPLELQFQTAVDINIKEIDSNSCLNLENIASCSHNLPQKNSSGKIFLGCSETVMDKDSKTKDACKSQVSESLQVKNSSAAVPSKKLKTHHLPTDNPLELQFQTAVDINIKEIDSNSCLNLENIASCSHNLPQKNSSGKIFLGCSETVMDKDSKTKDACKSQVSESLQVKNSSAAVPSKKLKTHHLPTDNPLELQFQTAVDINIKEIDSNSCLNLENIASCSHNLPQKNSAGIVSLDCSETVIDKDSKTKDACKSQVSESLQVKNSSAAAASSKLVSDDNEKPSDLKILTGTVDRPSIDRCVILFILQISFHIEKRTNSHMAEKSFFSVLIDYLCLIHKPCLKAETVLSNLIRNRYCLEKLIVNGFFCELEEKMSAYEKILCSYHSHVSSVYSNLVNVGRQEMESDDYGIGTLSRILITSDKKGQLHAICTLSKLVIEKISLYRLLIETKGLSLLLEFLSNSDDRIRRKAVMSLHEIYTSLTKKKKDPFKCCFGKTCAMGTSTKCFYKESFLNVTFVVGGGAKILANREKVCENSDYFQALLDGHFRESSSELVVFPHISAENLSAIFHFLHGCGNGSTCPYITRIPFSVLLELLSDSEKFLLTNIKTFVEDRLCHCLLSSQISKIYNQSKLHNSPALAKRALNEALRTVSSQKSLILATFKELLDTASNVNVYSDIEELIKSLLL